MLTDKTIATKTALKLELEQVRKTGIAFNNEGAYEGVDGIASEIRDVSGRVVAGLGFSVPIFRSNKAYYSKLASLIKMGGCVISYQLGFEYEGNLIRNVEQILLWWKKNQLSSTSQQITSQRLPTSKKVATLMRALLMIKTRNLFIWIKPLVKEKKVPDRRALPGETRDDYRVWGETVLAPPVCCPWRNRASGIPPVI